MKLHLRLIALTVVIALIYSIQTVGPGDTLPDPASSSSSSFPLVSSNSAILKVNPANSNRIVRTPYTRASRKVVWENAAPTRSRRIPASMDTDKMLAVVRLECLVDQSQAQEQTSNVQQKSNSKSVVLNVKSELTQWLAQQTDPRKLDHLTALSVRASHAATVQAMRKLSAQETAEIPESVLALSFSKSNIGDLARFKSEAESDDCVVAVEPDVKLQISMLPNDSFYAQQTHHAVIGSPQAWDFVQRPNRGANTKIIVAVIDTGVEYTHPDLQDMMWRNTDNTYGANYVNDTTDPMDDHGTGTCPSGSGSSHGTHVAGIIAAKFNNNVGVAGVNGFSTQLMAVKVADHCGSAYSSDIVNALNFAAQHGAKVINISLGSGETSDATRAAMQAASQMGASVVIAAGNTTQTIGVGGFTYPCAYAKDVPGAICVGSMDATTGTLSSFSNRSPTYVEIVAPGSANTGIFSTIRGANYGAKQGTSMASPVVTGALSLAWSVSVSNGMGLSPAQIKQILLQTATKKPEFQSAIKDGNQLNIGNLIRTLYQQYVIQAQAGLDDFQ